MEDETMATTMASFINAAMRAIVAMDHTQDLGNAVTPPVYQLKLFSLFTVS